MTGEESGGVRGDLASLRTVANYQFGRGAGEALFPPDESDIEVRRTGSGRPRQVITPGGRITSYGTDGLFTLGIEGGRRLRAAFDPPRLRVVVGTESAPYVRDGRNAFAKFVASVDPGIRPGDEVLVTLDPAAGNNPDYAGDSDDLLAVGRAELSADAMADFETGVAVTVREGAGE